MTKHELLLLITIILSLAYIGWFAFTLISLIEFLKTLTLAKVLQLPMSQVLSLILFLFIAVPVFFYVLLFLLWLFKEGVNK